MGMIFKVTLETLGMKSLMFVLFIFRLQADGAGSARTGTSRKTSSSKAASSSRSSEAQLNHAPSAASATEKDNAAAKGKPSFA